AENTTKKNSEKNIPPNMTTAKRDLEGTISFRKGFNYSFIEGVDRILHINLAVIHFATISFFSFFCM
ncbi:hypothetical protein, partial [Colwellia sp. BRX10-7]|uniref:hypothetical protein n=1 Tax=Colwellia sp. BRX10-7 TaxID=2759840 RepID=UPI001C711228